MKRAKSVAEALGEEQPAEKSKKVKKLRSSEAASEPKAKERASHFLTYDLQTMGLPAQAWPEMDKVYHGRHGYTINSRSGAVPWFHLELSACRHNDGIVAL